MSRRPPEPIAVVGGGIAGLAAAWQLHRDGMGFRLYEAAESVGGKLRASPIAGCVVDDGADAFLARVPHGTDLAIELGLGDQLISPTARRAQVWTGETLEPLPEPNVLGIPLEVDVAEKMLGAEAADALRADLARIEPDPIRPDETIGSLIRRRLGDTIHEALVDPLLGAISAGDTDRLALDAASPQIAAAAAAGPSLVGTLRRQAEQRDPIAPVFHSFAGGITTIVDALAERLGDRLETGVAVHAISRLPDGLRLDLDSGESVFAPAAIVATPSDVAADVLRAWPHAAGELAAIPLVSVAFVTLAFEAGTIPSGGEFSGFVVPRNDGKLRITACSYTSAKWPHLAADLDIVRLSVGHAHDQSTPELPDDDLVTLVRADLATATGVDVEPKAARISRWPCAFPQYEVGHGDRIARIEGALNPDGVFVAGMAYRGVGIPASIDSGRTAAVEALLHVLDDTEAAGPDREDRPAT